MERTRAITDTELRYGCFSPGSDHRLNFSAWVSAFAGTFRVRCEITEPLTFALLSAEQVVTLVPCAAQAGLVRQLGLPASVQARFVRVLLNTGEWEVLVTSLLDEIRYPTTEFRSLYARRWGIETFYGLLKTRLDLENFTGNGAEAVRQDFHATIDLSGRNPS
jgi:hypothetical protein